MMCYMTLVGQHCRRNRLNFPHHEFVAMFFTPFVSHFLFSFNRVPIKTPWEQERMGNSFGAIVLWKTTINMMPVFGAFFSNKDTFKKINYILCVFEISCTIYEMGLKSGCIFTWTCGVIYESSVKAARTCEWAWS